MYLLEVYNCLLFHALLTSYIGRLASGLLRYIL
jgi:hypothetical protein